MIDEEKVLEMYKGLMPLKKGSESPLIGDDEGLIKFGLVNLTNLPVDHYSQAALEWRDEVREELGKGVAKNPLISAGHECGYNTLSAIYLSDAFQENIAPVCDDKDDLVRALALAPRAFGMARFRVVKASEEEVIFRSYSSPDADYFMEHHDEESEDNLCDRHTGVFTAIPNLVFRGDAKNDRDQVYEEEPDVFHPEAYYGKEVKCRAAGDDYCEIVVRKEFNNNNDMETPEKYR